MISVPQSKLKPHHTFYRLGLWYGAYRFTIACSLLLIFLFTSSQLEVSYNYPKIYLWVLVSYAIFSVLQLVAFKFYKKAIQYQLLCLCIIDIFAFSLLTFSMGGPNLHISLIFVITIFIANLLLSHKTALFLTLTSIITVVYLQLFGSWFDAVNLSNIGSSALLAFLFFVVYVTAQFAVQRFKVLEALTINQSLELMQLQDINRYILEQLNMGYLVLDQEQNIVLSNPAAYQLLDIPVAYSFKKVPLRHLHTELFNYLKQKPPHQGERFVFEPVQSRFNIHIQIQKLNAPKNQLTLLIMQDAQKLNQHVQQLKLAALGQLSASIAHEIRNPLASIVQANHLFLDSDEQEKQNLHRIIEKQSQRIDSIIQSTLNMARTQATRPKEIELRPFLYTLLQEDFYSDLIKIKLKIRQNIRISFDEDQLRQVLVNLIKNALQHNDPQRANIEISTYTRKDSICIDIIDFGQGIKSEDVKNLFSPFFTTKINGTGLGLYLSHSFCEANQATLEYIKLPTGTCFRIECAYIQEK